MARQKARYRHVTITPQQGGQLVGAASDDIAGSSNYTEKINFRRETDGELRREGWELFDPTGRNTPLDTEFPIRLLYQFPSTTGEGILIAAAGGSIYRLQAGSVGYAYDEFESYAEPGYYLGSQETFWWEKIYDGLSHMDALEEDGTNKNPFEGGAYRWEAVTVLNHVVISNGVDLPVIYKAEWNYAQPLFNLREQGIVSCGTIASYQDRLFVGDLTTIISGYEQWFEQAVDPYGDPYTDELIRTGSVKLQRYQYRMLYSMEQNPKMFDTAESGGLIATLEVGSNGAINIGANLKFKVGSIEEGAPLISEAQSFLDEEAIVINSTSFGVKTEDEQYAIENNGLTSRLFLQESGSNKYKLTGRYDNNTIFGTTQLGLKYTYSGRFDFVSRQWPNQSVGNYQRISPNAPIYLGSDESSALSVDSNGQLEITFTQYSQLPLRTYGSNILQDNAGLYYWQKLHLGKDVFEPDVSQGRNYTVVNRDSNNPGFLTYDFPIWTSVSAYPVGTTVRFGAQFYKASEAVNAGEDNPADSSKWSSTTGYLAQGTYEVLIKSYLNELYSNASAREFADDGTRILKMVPLADKLVVYRDSGFFFISRSNVTVEPFAVEPKYTGGRVADYRHTIANLDGKRHIFLGSSGVYSISRSSAEPEPVSVFELGPAFWKTIPPEYSEFVYAADNPVTREMFLSVPTGYMKNAAGEYIDQSGAVTSKPVIDWGTIAFDYISKTLSQIDASFTCACYARKPRLRRIGPEQSWFLMGLHASEASPFYIGTKYRPDNQYNGVVARYGYGPPEVGDVEPYRIYTRLGYGYTSKLKSGLIDFGDSFSDKEVRSYVLELSNKYGTTPVDVIISTTSAVQGTEQIETMSTVNGRDIKHVTLNEIRDENMIPLYVRAPYIRDELRVKTDYTINSAYVTPDYYMKNYINDDIEINPNPIKIVGKTYDVSGIDTRQATQTIGQG